MKKILVMLALLCVAVFTYADNQSPIKPIKPTTMEKTIEEIKELDLPIDSVSKSEISFFIQTIRAEVNNKSITSHWKAEVFLGFILLLLGMAFIGRTKRKRVVSLKI